MKSLGEHRYAGSEADLDYLRAVGLVHAELSALSEQGSQLFAATHIKGDAEVAADLMREALRSSEPAAALLQLLAGLGPVPRARAETVLRSQRLDEGLSARSLGTLLAILNRFGLVKYSKGDGTVEVILKPQFESQPAPSVYISPDAPYGNKIWLRRVLEECDEHIYWLDKHFLALGLEPLWEAADRAKIDDIRVLSLKLEGNANRGPRRACRDLRLELANRGIAFEWRFIDSTAIRQTHDRWIIGKSVARNVPDVGSVFSGKHSELNKSDQVESLNALFLSYWERAAPMDGAREGEIE